MLVYIRRSSRRVVAGERYLHLYLYIFITIESLRAWVDRFVRVLYVS
jgi:hypothetical protein